MKTLLSLSVLTSLIFGQFGAPAIASSPQNVEKTPVTTESVTETPTPKDDSSTKEIETTPNVTETSVPPIQTETPVPVSDAEVSILSLSTNPDFITPGGNLLLQWEIQGLPLNTSNPLLQITIPEGFSIQDKVDGKFDDATRILTIAVNALSGEINLEAQADITDTLFYAILLDDSNTLAET